MYVRSTPPAGLTLQGLVDWLLLEFQSLETALQEQEEEIRILKENQDVL